MTYEVIDFRKPGRVSEDISHMLSRWQHGAREAIEYGLGRHLTSRVKIGPVPPSPLTGTDLRTLGESVIVYRVDLGETGQPTLFLINSSLAVALVHEVLGNPCSELPEGRPLTDIETTCLGYLVDELTVAIQSGQSLKPRRKLEVVGRVQLKELHTQFPENVTNTDVGFRFELPYGSDLVRWVLPQDATLDMVSSFATQDVSNSQTRDDLERHILCAGAELRVRLGRSQVRLSSLANLKEGDMIVLDQRVEDPLVAELGGQPLFLGWGCRVGKQQVFQIETEIGQGG